MKIEVGPSRFKSVGEKRLQVSRQKSTRLDLSRLTPNTSEYYQVTYICMISLRTLHCFTES